MLIAVAVIYDVIFIVIRYVSFMGNFSISGCVSATSIPSGKKGTPLYHKVVFSFHLIRIKFTLAF